MSQIKATTQQLINILVNGGVNLVRQISDNSFQKFSLYIFTFLSVSPFFFFFLLIQFFIRGTYLEFKTPLMAEVEY